MVQEMGTRFLLDHNCLKINLCKFFDSYDLIKEQNDSNFYVQTKLSIRVKMHEIYVMLHNVEYYKFYINIYLIVSFIN